MVYGNRPKRACGMAGGAAALTTLGHRTHQEIRPRIDFAATIAWEPREPRVVFFWSGVCRVRWVMAPVRSVPLRAAH